MCEYEMVVEWAGRELGKGVYVLGNDVQLCFSVEKYVLVDEMLETGSAFFIHGPSQET